ncbi:MAG: choline/ethanolamine kinase family protein [Pseudomonadota bacterium]
MSQDKVRSMLLERVEEWRFANIERIPQGHTESAYRLSLSGRRAFFKYEEATRAPFKIPRHLEAEIQRLAASRGLAPGVYYVDDDCMLTEYVDGRVLADSDFHDREMLVRIGLRLREVHKLPLCGLRFNAMTAATHYAMHAPDAKIAERCLAAVASLPWESAELAFCHNDLAVGNLILDDDIHFIDWEYACDNSPLFDLATVIAHHNLDTSEARVLVEAYFGTCSEDHLARLAVYERGYHALHWLWMAAKDPGDRRLNQIAAEISF